MRMTGIVDFARPRQGALLAVLALVWLSFNANSCGEKNQQTQQKTDQTAIPDSSLRGPGDTIQYVLMGSIQDGEGLVGKLYQVGAPGGRKVVAQTQLDGDGNFKIVQKHATPRVYKLEFDAGHKYLYLDRDTIRVKGHIEDIPRLEVLNSELTAQLYEFWQSKHRAENLIRHHRRKMRKAGNPATKKAHRDSMKRAEATKQERLDTYYKSFIASTDTSVVSAKAALAMNEYDNYDYLQSLSRYYNQHCPYLYEGQQLTDKLYYYRDIVPGAQAPEITAQDTAGHTVRLSDFRGQFVLLHFWLPASSRAKAQMEVLYDLKDEPGENANLEIVSYSFNIQKSYWKNGIEASQADWVHISNLAGYEVPVTQDYLVEKLPMYYLIDPEGRIINRYRFARKAASEIQDLLPGE